MSPAAKRILGRVTIGAAVVLGLVGASILAFHLLTDPLADVRAYYDAGSRLNTGAPLYPPGADPDATDFYRYPPLLALVFRPLARLPFEWAAGIWGVLMVVAFGWTIRRLGARDRSTWLAIGILAGPIAWALAVGQAQTLTTLLLAVGNPAAVALAGQLKVFPALVALYWVGRRDWRRLGEFAAWNAGWIALQWILAPADTVAFVGVTNLGAVGDVNNLSPYAVSPLLWGVFVVVGLVVALRLAPTRFGWVAAVTVAVLATPRLLEYMLMTLLAGLRGPDEDAQAKTGP